MVYIVILNWNGWRDTLECLESVFRNDYPSYRVIVCDNDSHDQSLERIKDWAEGRLQAPGAVSEKLQRLSYPASKKPISYIEYDRAQAESGGAENDVEARLVLIRTGANLGFAGGNNVGIRYAQARGDYKYIWLLNNDTVIEHDALTQLVSRIRTQADAGICGSTLVYYHNPERVQALGGATYNKWRAQSRHIGAFTNLDEVEKNAQVEQQMAYVIGASMLVQREFIEEVGLMCEDYFLYYEEIDWACRGASRYNLCYAPKSIVYHKEGASIGTDAKQTGSTLSLYYLYRNRLRFVKKFYRPYLFLGYLNIGWEAFKAFVRGRRSASRVMIDVMLDRPFVQSKD